MSTAHRSLFAAFLLALPAGLVVAQDPPTQTPAPQARGVTDKAELQAFLDGMLPALMRDKHVAGATIAVVKDGQLYFSKGYGWQDVDKRIPVDPEKTWLYRVVGLGRAKHLILTGESIDARTALDWGLVSAVVPAADLPAAARALADRVLARGPLAIRLAKLALNASARVDLDSGLLIETLAQALCFSSEDKVEGASAFLEKRKPKFTGR